jgi:hypothetical protein
VELPGLRAGQQRPPPDPNEGRDIGRTPTTWSSGSEVVAKSSVEKNTKPL